MIPNPATLPRSVRIVEVGPRDGLQNEKALIPTEQKIQFINLLAEAGLPVVEATSFVSPRAIPQLSDASAVMAGITRLPATSYPVLVPNLKGLERALAAGVRAIAVFTAEGVADAVNASSLRLFSPDAVSKEVKVTKASAKAVEFVVPALDVYDIIAFD